MLVINKEFIRKWSSVYNERFKDGEDESEEITIRSWLSEQKEPKFLNKEYFVRLGRWKTKRATKHYKTNDENEIIKITRTAYLASDESHKLNILRTLRGVGIAVAATILHYLQPDVFPIFDYHVRYALKEANLWTRDKDDASEQAWLDYLKIMRGLSDKFGVSLRDLDKAMFAYDKRAKYTPLK